MKPLVKPELQPMFTHRVSVTVSNPHHRSDNFKHYQVEKRAKIRAKTEADALKLAKDFYAKSGYKVHAVRHLEIK